MPRVLAVDYGRSRVGLALSDPLGRTAQPLEVVERPRRGSLVEAVAGVVRRVEADEIVVGLPLRPDGSEGVAAEATRSFGKVLGERTGLPVTFWDERMTTVEASREMRSAGVSSRRQRGIVDKVAAAVLLRSFLEARSPGRTDVVDVSLPEPGRAGSDKAPRPGRRERRSDREEGRRQAHEPRSSREEWRDEMDGR